MEAFITRTRYSTVSFIIILLFASAGKLGSQAEPTPSSTALAKQSSSLSPQDLFGQVSGSIFVVEVINPSGTPVAQGSGVAIAPHRVVTNKHVVIEGEK